MNRPPILFDDFVPGQMIGESAEQVTPDQLQEWSALYPWDAAGGDLVPSGFATILMMRAYLNVVTPRPPGNLHVQQQMRLYDAIRSGESVTTRIGCYGKELKGVRRKVELLAEGRGNDDRSLYDGIITLFWAA